MSLGMQKGPIRCDCETRKYCRRDDMCPSPSFVGSLAVNVYDCRYGTDCGYKYTNYCVCEL